jgi:hypothetical protein
MRTSLAERLPSSPRKALGFGSESVSPKGEADHKKVVDAKKRAFVAEIVGRAFDRSGISKKKAAQEMGFGEDQSAISRWVAGLEPPTLARMLAVRELRRGLAIALAETDEDALIQTVVTFSEAKVS